MTKWQPMPAPEFCEVMVCYRYAGRCDATITFASRDGDVWTGRGGKPLDGTPERWAAMPEWPEDWFPNDDGGKKRARSTPYGRTANPDPELIRAMRQSMGMSQTAAGLVVHAPLRTWQAWEGGERRMHPATWELWGIKVKAISADRPRPHVSGPATRKAD